MVGEGESELIGRGPFPPKPKIRAVTTTMNIAPAIQPMAALDNPVLPIMGSRLDSWGW